MDSAGIELLGSNWRSVERGVKWGGMAWRQHNSNTSEHPTAHCIQLDATSPHPLFTHSNMQGE